VGVVGGNLGSSEHPIKVPATDTARRTLSRRERRNEAIGIPHEYSLTEAGT
jgi:hypothetical protein